MGKCNITKFCSIQARFRVYSCATLARRLGGGWGLVDGKRVVGESGGRPNLSMKSGIKEKESTEEYREQPQSWLCCYCC